ncbi:MAG: P-loop NTPase [Desulfobacterales bacterium]
MDKHKNITAIIGPKGGVGKSTISANLAIALSKMGKKVVAVDLDLGASNLHSIFGIRGSPLCLSDFLQKKVKNLTDVILDTDIANVGIICGGDVPGISNLAYQQKMKLIRHLSTIDCDFVLLDLAPGASHNVVDFSIAAQQTLLITTPEVPSLLNVYSFIKSAVFRRLAFFFKREKCNALLALLEEAKKPDLNPHLKTMAGFFAAARQTDARVADPAQKMLTGLKPLVIVNRIRTEKDARTGGVIRKLMKEYLDIDSAIIMTIREDDAVGRAIAKLKPVLLEAPNSPFARDIETIAAQIC